MADRRKAGEESLAADSRAKRRSTTVLVVDNERYVLDEVRALLESHGMEVLTAASGREAFDRLRSLSVDVALVDWQLEDEDGIALGRSLQRERGIPFVVFSGFLTTDATGYGYQQGAADVIDKPIRPGRLLSAVECAARRPRRRVTDELPVVDIRTASDSISDRWARVVLQAIYVSRDPHKEQAVAEASHMSESAFHKVCDAVDVSAKATRDLARMLRANVRAQNGSRLRDHLSTLDNRTRMRLFEEAGIPVNSGEVPFHTFFFGQRFVSPAKECLQRLMHMAANSPLFFIGLEPDTSRAVSETLTRRRRRSSR
jgi:DNA-binding response OmpR family regulator